MQNTAIRLLLAGGSAQFTFTPALTTDQYNELRQILIDLSRDKLTVQVIEEWAIKSHLSVTVDGRSV